MKRGACIAVAVVFYGVALAALAPAWLADTIVQRASDGRVRLAAVRGTLWSGSAVVTAGDANASVRVGALEWQATGVMLLPLGVRFAVDAGATPFVARLSPVALDIDRARIEMTARALAIAVPRLASIEPTGDVTLELSRVSRGRGGASGSATVRWSNAGSALTRVAPLGAYVMRVTRTSGAVDATLSTVSGPLQIEGRGGWPPGARPSFTAIAYITAHEREIAPLLRLFAIERGDGRFELQL